MRSLGHVLFINLYHGFTSYFLLLLDHKSVSSSLLVLLLILFHCHVQVRKSSWSHMIQSTPVKATSSQRAQSISLLWLGGLLGEGRQRKS